MAAKTIPALTEKDLARIISRIQINPISGCHEWTGSTSGGYARTRINNSSLLVHRIMFVLANGEPDPNLHLDHLCRNRKCANPEHLEAVTARENILRGHGLAALNIQKAECPRGHALIEENLIPSLRHKGRACHACDVAARAARHRNLSGAERETFIQERADRNYDIKIALAEAKRGGTTL